VSDLDKPPLRGDEAGIEAAFDAGDAGDAAGRHLGEAGQPDMAATPSSHGWLVPLLGMIVGAAGRLARAALGLLALAVLLLGVAWALAHNEAATSYLLPMLPGVKATQAQGALLGDFKAQRVDVSLPRGGSLSLIEPTWRSLQIKPDANAPWLIGLDMVSLSAQRLDVKWVPNPVSSPLAAPKDVILPVSVHVQRLQLAQAHSSLWGEAPLMALDAELRLQGHGTRMAQHQLKLARLTWQNWVLSGDVQLGVQEALPLSAHLVARVAQPLAEQAVTLNDKPAASSQLQLQPQPRTEPARPLEALGSMDLRLSGTLAAMVLQADASWQRPSSPRQRLQLSGELAPFAPWPVPRLQAQAEGLNLADLLPSLPQTALQGELMLAPAGKQDLHLQLDVRNALAGAWDAQRLPARVLKGDITLLGARVAKDLPAMLQGGELALAAQLPSVGQHADGRLAVQGGWGGSRSLRAQWQGVEPQALHVLAPPLSLQGSLLIKPQWPVAQQALAQRQPKPTSDAKGAASSAAAPGEQWANLQAAVSLDMQGVYGASAARVRPQGKQALPDGLPVSVNLLGHYAPRQFDVTTLSLRARDAVAELKASAVQWGGSMPWQVKAQGQVHDFDPQVWMPWPAAVTGRNALSGHFDVQLDASWHGQIQARLDPSMLGGVPLHGQANWRSPVGKAVMSVLLDLDAAGNTLQAQAELPWQASQHGALRWGPDAQWQASIHAPALQGLQALAPLLGARQVSGLIDGQAKAQGVWPAMRTDGQLAISKLQWLGEGGAVLSLASAKADWRIDTHSPDAPLHLALDMTQGQNQYLELRQAQWRLDGSAKAHSGQLTIDVTHKSSGQGQGQSTGANNNAATGSKPTPFHLAMAGQGSWLVQTGNWQGQISDLLLRMDGTKPRVLVQAQPFSLSWHQDERRRAFQVGATSVNLLGAAMRLTRLSWQQDLVAAGLQANPYGDTDVQLQLEPLNLPALLASWQPQAGWGGDLLLGGQIRVRHSLQQPWLVDAEVSRQSGDLSLAEPTIEGNTAQRLGIRSARMALQAKDGVWTLSEQFDGRVLGVLTGKQVVRTSSPHALPAGADALSGELDLQVSSLRPWGTWVPAGWRLTGQLQAQARLAGTLGAPQYRGQVNGQNLGLGQALQGINLSDGVLDMALEGEHVRLNKLSARGGSGGGTLSATGQATLGASPQAQLVVTADHFALLQRVDRRVVISGDAQALLGEEDVQIDGRIKVDEGLIDITRADAPTVGDDVNVLHRPGQDPDAQEDAASANGNGNGVKRKLTLALDVDLGHKLRLKGRGLDAYLAGALKVSTPGNKLAANGAVRVENGTYAAYGQKLVIERGSVAFTGPIENPRLDILAMRAQSATASSSDVKVGVAITGTALDPRVRLYSDPSMSETEKLSWLVLGRAPTGLGGADIGLLQSAAVALLSGEGSSPSDNLVAKLGLDELSIRQSDNSTVRETVVNVGKQVSKFWYVGYERNLAATSGNWQLIYRLAQRFTLRAQAGDDNAVDFIWSWRWD
jgi:translocation and assembly module TamB